MTAAFHDEDAHQLYVAPERDRRGARAAARIRLSSIDQDQPFSFRAQTADIAARGIKEAEPELEKLARSGYRTVVAFARRGEGERAAYNLGRLKVRWLDGAAADDGPARSADHVRARAAADRLHRAAVPPRGDPRAPAVPPPPGCRSDGRDRTRRRGVLRSFADLRTGDIVVHEDHGIARFAGFDTKTVADVTRDYLYLEYAGSDRVFVPVDQLAKISRYVGAGGAHPPLSKLGGTRWDTIKARARRAAQELAGELLNLYAERKRREGHEFPVDTDWQREFEDAFPFTETPDQRDAIEFVKADMEAPRPMDRLICGDVGYGKTEVALRAAFKAVQDGKQVMLLVPTTILAQQHYGTFTERLKDYPVTIEHVSRFRPAAEQREAVARFAKGEVDILIGTHRLLSRDVRAKDLGLLIVDEEQRFGVKQKELLRQLKLTRRRDLDERHADPAHAADVAGRRARHQRDRDPARGPAAGQDLRRRVRRGARQAGARSASTSAAARRSSCTTGSRRSTRRPSGCAGCARGCASRSPTARWTRRSSRSGCSAFLRGDADVLVCTTIIESGIDIPQANTLIVERADAFGLAQLYQIRGRVGRSRERAYAYLLYPSAAALTPEAAQRLSALSDYTELGAGFKIAMRDLEIRGAGNLLGDEQSGHVAALGFELYMQMLDEAVAAADATGRTPTRTGSRCASTSTSTPTCRPTTSPTSRPRSTCTAGSPAPREVADLVLLREELEDRFGELPEPLRNLIALQQARIKLGQAGATRGHVPRRAARGDADRARLGPGQEDPGRDPRGAVRVGQVAAVGARPRRSRASGSRRSCARPTCCWR